MVVLLVQVYYFSSFSHISAAYTDIHISRNSLQPKIFKFSLDQRICTDSKSALAYWLSRIDAEITLIERFPDLRASGQQIDLRNQGIPMMRKMGIEAAIREVVVQYVQSFLHFPLSYQ